MKKKKLIKWLKSRIETAKSCAEECIQECDDEVRATHYFGEAEAYQKVLDKLQPKETDHVESDGYNLVPFDGLQDGQVAMFSGTPCQSEGVITHIMFKRV